MKVAGSNPAPAIITLTCGPLPGPGHLGSARVAGWKAAAGALTSQELAEGNGEGGVSSREKRGVGAEAAVEASVPLRDLGAGGGDLLPALPAF